MAGCEGLSYPLWNSGPWWIHNKNEAAIASWWWKPPQPASSQQLFFSSFFFNSRKSLPEKLRMIFHWIWHPPQRKKNTMVGSWYHCGVILRIVLRDKLVTSCYCLYTQHTTQWDICGHKCLWSLSVKHQTPNSELLSHSGPAARWPKRESRNIRKPQK